MKGITIRDRIGHRLSFDLFDILQVLDDRTVCSDWVLSGVEASGESSDEIHSLSDSGIFVGGDRLLRIASTLNQTIDGKFEAYVTGSSSPRIIIRAIDGSEFDVEADEQSILDRFARRFSDITQIEV